MYTTVNEHDFIDAFRRFDRLDTGDGSGGNFTPDALRALFEWYENLEDDTGEPFELDVVGICCDWSEHESLEEAAEEYNNDAELASILNKYAKDETKAQFELYDWFVDHTTVIRFDSGVLILKF